MRKKSIKRWWDYTFWYIIYLLPIILAIVMAINSVTLDGVVNWTEYDGDWTNFPVITMLRHILDTWGFGGDAFIGQALYSIFDIDSGIFPVIYTGDSWIYQFAEYFVTMVVIHLMVDFLLFIPRIAHKWMDKCYMDD